MALIETIWSPAHEARKISSKEVRNRVNALLRSRGETYEYNSREIGWRLKHLNLHCRPNGNGRALHFSSEIRHRIHQLAREFGLNLPIVKDCPDCMEPKLIDK